MIGHEVLQATLSYIVTGPHRLFFLESSSSQAYQAAFEDLHTTVTNAEAIMHGGRNCASTGVYWNKKFKL